MISDVNLQKQSKIQFNKKGTKLEKLTRDERIKQKIKVVKDNQRINSSIYKDNIGIDDIIHNTGLK